MKIRNQTELKLFEETLDSCTSSVLLVTQQGEQYDLSDPATGTFFDGRSVLPAMLARVALVPSPNM